MDAGRVDEPYAVTERVTAPPPRADEVHDPAEYAAMTRLWDKHWGDRRQEIALIGIGLDRRAISADLDACLLTAREMNEGPRFWRNYPDPFPRWRLGGDEPAA